MKTNAELNLILTSLLDSQRDDFQDELRNCQYGTLIQLSNNGTTFTYGDKCLCSILNVKETDKQLLQDVPMYLIKSELPFILQVDSQEYGTTYKTEFKSDENWYQVVYKLVEEKESNGLVVSGLVINITTKKKIEDLESLQQIHMLAINGGGIGIFHYDVEKYGTDIFKANQVYEDIIGIDSIGDQLYAFSDYEKCLLKIEKEIYKKAYEDYSFQKILDGVINKTEDDLLKIKNPKTGKIKYLLSSSLVESRDELGNFKKFGGVVIDITQRVIDERNNIIYVYQDNLTSLPNKRKLMLDLENIDNGLGLFFDLDGFKKINDTYGHQFGDEALQAFGQCLEQVKVLFPNSKVYRLYGDEFFVYLDSTHKEKAYEFNKELVSRTDKISQELGINEKIHASMGVSIYDKTKGVDEFIKLADYSMFSEKIKNRK